MLTNFLREIIRSRLLKIIKLKEFGFDALDNLYVMSREESVNMLIDTLKNIEEVNQFKASIESSKNKGLNDVAGIVTNLNAELEIKGFIIVL
jgi:hypothetical protein